jgi:catechol 2,3-dioxygenase-like lactoylglutathione lyase family enzyme
MPHHPLDHLVLAVRDLDAAVAFYERLGFQVGARNRHPWGTENRIVQFSNVFLELITVGEGASIPEHGDGVFSFGAFVRDYLLKHEGFAMLVLASSDAKADQAAFDHAGIGGFENFYFERKAVRPDGTPVEVAFTLAFARDALNTNNGFFVCEQHRPENFWNANAQSHPNGTSRFASVTMVAHDPSDHAEFFSHFTGIRAFSATSAGLRFETDHGELEILSEPAYRFEFGLGAPLEKPALSAFTVAVDDLSKVEARLTSQSVPHKRVGEALIVAPEQAFGVAIRFVQAA